MQVVAAAGHVGHGKCTLVRVLTGMEPGLACAECVVPAVGEG